jgi:hypothetical protein
VSWTSPARYVFSLTSILGNAPEQSGVYALHSDTTWVYVGESANIRAHLLEHLNGSNVCVNLYPRLYFSYELIAEPVRAWRHDQVLREFRPTCNPRPG